MNTNVSSARRLALVALVAGSVALPAPADAIPDVGQGDTAITVVVPDPTNPLAVCRHEFAARSRVTFTSIAIGTGTAHEWGSGTVKTTGCANSWTVTVTIINETLAGTGGNVSVTGAAGPANPATRSVSQDVPHATTGRVASLVEVTVAASSAKASFCQRDIWQVSALGNPSPVSSDLC